MVNLEHVTTIKIHRDVITAIALSDDGTLLYSASGVGARVATKDGSMLRNNPPPCPLFTGSCVRSGGWTCAGGCVPGAFPGGPAAGVLGQCGHGYHLGNPGPGRWRGW